MINYRILQLDPDNKTVADNGLLFSSWEKMEPHCNRTIYKEIYRGEIEESDDIMKTLEYLFMKFNRLLPDDFTGHSMSVSDIVEFPDLKKAFYCDSKDWILLTDSL